MIRCPECGHAFNAPIAAKQIPPTKRQAEMYRFIATYSKREGYAPTNQEIADHFGYRSLATVIEHLDNLERKGWITRRYNEARSITCLVPVDDMGAVQEAAAP